MTGRREGAEGAEREHHRMRQFAYLLATASLLAACGSSSKSHTTPTQSAATTATTPTTSSTATASTQTSSVPSGTPRCRASDLALSFLGQQGATGHGELGFSLRNTSGSSCHTYGYPGILFLDKAGAALPTVPTHTTQDLFGNAPATRLVVAPGGEVSFRLGVTHGVSSTAGCATAYGLQVIPPNDTATLRTTIADGAYECQTATVSPLQPDNSAYR